MNYFKLFTLTVLALCFTSQLLGQSRNPKQSNSLTIQSQSEKLRTATGWQQDLVGNWISNQNAISDTELNESTQYTVPQNFKWVQLISLKNGEQDLYALLYETTVYISNTQNERRVYYYLMTSKSYASIATTVASKSGETLTIHSSSYGYMSDNDGIYSASKLLQLMKQSIQSGENSPKYDFSINAQHVDNEDVVRFLLPEKSNVPNKALTNSYFETKWDEFNKILLPTPKQIIKEEFDLGDIAVATTTTNVNAVPASQNNQESHNMVSRTEIEESDFEPRLPAADTIQATPVQETENLTIRKNKEKATISAPIASFSGIEGWYLNGESEWVTDTNYSYRFETVGRYEIRNFRYDEKDYLLIIRFEKYAGESFYLISKEDYVTAFANLENSSIIRFPLVAHADLSNTLDDMIRISEQAIDTPKRKDAIIFKTNYLVLQYKLSSSKNLARFFVFQQECSKYGSETSKESCNAKISSKIKYDDEPLLGSDVLFSKMYYESTYDKFMDFFQKPITTNAKPNNNNDDDGLAPR